MTTHRELALDRLEEAADRIARLDAARREPVINAKLIDRLSMEKRDAIKLAGVHAVLDVADAFRDWTKLADEPIAEPADLVVLAEKAEEKALAECTDSTDCASTMHAASCPADAGAAELSEVRS